MTNVITDPAFLAYRLDFARECVEFIRVERTDLRRVAWLRLDALAESSSERQGIGASDDERPREKSKERVSVPLKRVVETLDAQPDSNQKPQINFIFHTAYCASTYLSRCLDVQSHSLSLREPQILLDAANAKRLQWQSTSTSLGYKDLPQLAIKLLSKHADGGENLIIKPINSVNNIIVELLNSSPQARAVLLYTDARNFMLSALRKGEASRQIIRSMFDLLRCDFPHLANLRLSDVIHMSDLKLMLTFWRLQIEQADAVTNQFVDQGRLTTLFAEDLIANPLQKMSAVDEFFQLGLGESKLKEIVQSDESQRDAKQPTERFSVDKRAQQFAELERIFGQDLDKGLNWMLKNNPRIALQPKFKASL